jgi:hypothetical protein
LAAPVEVAVQRIEGGLIAGISVDRGHEAGLDADGVVQHFCDWREAVGGAGAVRDNQVILGQLVVIDAEHDGRIRAVGRRRYQHALGASGEMGRGLGLGAEDAGAFQRDVDAEFLPGQLGRIALGGDPDLAVADADRVAIDRHGAGEAAMHRIEAQEMGVGLDRAEIVDADHLDIVAAGLGNGAQHIAANAAKSVDRDPDCHLLSLLQ